MSPPLLYEYSNIPTWNIAQCFSTIGSNGASIFVDFDCFFLKLIEYPYSYNVRRITMRNININTDLNQTLHYNFNVKTRNPDPDQRVGFKSVLCVSDAIEKTF